MTIHTILHFPDQRLKTVAKPIKLFDKALQTLAQDMLETMYDSKGVGLAATQINVHERILVLDISDNQDEPHVFVNPEIIDFHGKIINKEGCLSFPGIFVDVPRHETICVKYYTEKGEAKMIDAQGLLSICLQHEIDHLDGITMYDKLSRLKKQRMEKLMEKLRKQTI